MTDVITNGAPKTVFMGIDDRSTRQLPAVSQAIPSHLPIFPLYTQKGPTTPQLVVGSAMTNMYGADSFNLQSAYANHSTVFANATNAGANQMFVWRVKPDDAAPPATLRLSIDLLPTRLPVYQRGTDGMIRYDSNNLPLVVVGQTVEGYKAKFVVSQIIPGVNDANGFGVGAQAIGDQTDGTTQSTVYPLFDFEVSSFGAWGNNAGVRIWAPTSASVTGPNTPYISNLKCYPFRIACINRADANSTPTIVNTLDASPYIDFVLKPDTIDKTFGQVVSIQDTFLKAYQSLNVPGEVDVVGPFGRFHTYDQNITDVLDLVYNAEKPYLDAFSDMTGAQGEEYLFNLFGGVSSINVPYHAYQVNVSDVNAVRLSDSTNLYAKGGSDGTMTDAAFAASVANMFTAFADDTSYLQDMAKYPISAVWDSGYPTNTKYALLNALAKRKDIAVFLGTSVAGDVKLTTSQESSMGQLLKARAQLYPESEFYGTSVCRAVVVSRSGLLVDGSYKKRLPLTYDLLVKVVNYMGASDGVWNKDSAFDTNPLNLVTTMSDINEVFAPASVRNKDWKNGMMWPENSDIKSVYFPAFRTVYDNDTSVLNNIFTMMCAVELEKVGDRVRRMFSNNTKLTRPQLLDRVVKEVNANTVNRFDDRFIILPEAYFTAADEARGYSYTLVIKLGANNSPTVMTLSIQTYRYGDLEQ